MKVTSLSRILYIIRDKETAITPVLLLPIKIKKNQKNGDSSFDVHPISPTDNFFS